MPQPEIPSPEEDAQVANVEDAGARESRQKRNRRRGDSQRRPCPVDADAFHNRQIYRLCGAGGVAFCTALPSRLTARH